MASVAPIGMVAVMAAANLLCFSKTATSTITTIEIKTGRISCVFKNPPNKLVNERDG
jgi:hypothetical protein